MPGGKEAWSGKLLEHGNSLGSPPNLQLSEGVQSTSHKLTAEVHLRWRKGSLFLIQSYSAF